MDASVKLIRAAGGVAILAHYFTCARKIGGNLLNRMLKDNRLDGAETVYGLFSLNTGSEIEKTVDKSLKVVKKLVRKHNKLSGGGVDAHNLQNFIEFANSGYYAKKTIGMAEKIIKQSGVKTKWSNF